MNAPKPFLEVLIPTYRRPDRAIHAIQSVLSTMRPDVGAFCQSNGHEQTIATLSEKHPEVRYRYFETNQGAVKNFRELIRQSLADYILFLSDEDRIRPKYMPDLIDHLHQFQPAFTFCRVSDSDNEDYFSLESLGVETINRTQVALLFPIDPTYISGFCYKRSAITDELLDSCFEEHSANAYPQILLRNAVLADGVISIFNRPIIFKGEEAQTGGDSHAHRPAVDTKEAKQLLNPAMYGAEARAKQFVYLQPRLLEKLSSLSHSSRAFIQLYLAIAWARITLHANQVTGQNFEFESYDSARVELYGNARPLAVPEAIYLRLITLQPGKIRNAMVGTLWAATKGIKLLLLTWQFGPSASARFLLHRRHAR